MSLNCVGSIDCSSYGGFPAIWGALKNRSIYLGVRTDVFLASGNYHMWGAWVLDSRLRACRV